MGIFGDVFKWFDGSILDQGLDVVGDIVGSITDSASTIGSVLKAGSDIFTGIKDIGGAAAPALESYFAAESIIYAAKQAQADYLAQAENYGFQAGIADLNGKIAAENLDYEVQMAYATEQMLERQNRRDLGEMQAVYGAAGVTMSGTAIDVMADSAAEGALSVALLNYQSDQRQKNLAYDKQMAELSAKNFRDAAERAEANADSAIREGEKSKDLQDIITIGNTISAVPAVAKGVGSLLDTVFGDSKK